MEKTETKVSVISKTVPPRRAVTGRFEVTPGNRRDDTVVWTLTAPSAAPCEDRRHHVHSTWTSRFWQWWTRALFNLAIKFFRKYWNMLFVVVVRENPGLVVLQQNMLPFRGAREHMCHLSHVCGSRTWAFDPCHTAHLGRRWLSVPVLKSGCCWERPRSKLRQSRECAVCSHPCAQTASHCSVSECEQPPPVAAVTTGESELSDSSLIREQCKLLLCVWKSSEIGRAHV